MEENKNWHNPELLEEVVKNLELKHNKKIEKEKNFILIYGNILNVIYIFWFFYLIKEYLSSWVSKIDVPTVSAIINFSFLIWFTIIASILLILRKLHLFFLKKDKYIIAWLIISIPILFFFFWITTDNQVNDEIYNNSTERPKRTLSF